jgi:hypothetical protein
VKIKYSRDKHSVVRRIFDHKVSYLILLLVMLASLILYLGRMGFSLEAVPALKEWLSSSQRFIGNKSPVVEHISIEIKDGDMQRLLYERALALENRYIDSKNAKYVPAKIHHDHKTYEAKIRLKGDRIDHIVDAKKWSFRIKIKGEQFLLGMKDFAIQAPKTRNHIGEWLFFKMLEKEGLVAMRYDFVTVSRNGKYLGVFALEERFNRRLIENNQYREGPIVRFHDDLFFENKRNIGEVEPAVRENDWIAYAAHIDGYGLKDYLNDPGSKAMYERAVSLLEGFRNRTLKPSEVFDVDKLARYYVITDVIGAKHANSYGNIKFYYNPITGLLEPVGYDANAGTKTINAFAEELALVNDPQYHQRRFEHRLNWILEDKAFYEKYISYIEKMTSSEYIKGMLAGFKDELQAKVNIIKKEQPRYEFNTEVIFNNGRYLRALINPVKGIHAYVKNYENNILTLSIGNIQYLPIEIEYISLDNVRIMPRNDEWIYPRMKGKAVDYQNLDFSVPSGREINQGDLDQLKIHYKVPGSTQAIISDVYPWDNFKEDAVRGHVLQQKSNVNNFPFLTVDEEKKLIIFRPGTWEIGKSLIIPEGYDVVCAGNTSLRMKDGAFILSRSPLRFEGDEENPIRLEGLDSKSGGLFVSSKGKGSLISNVEFIHLSNPSYKGWELTGAVTFYESPFEMDNCRFAQGKAEDMLNIVRSDFQINSSTFAHAFSDAIDIDFGNGQISNSSFVDSGNDAIDLSGAFLTASDILIDKAGDKGVSVGEASIVSILGLQVANSNMGVASKDNSKTSLREVTLDNCEIGFSAFQKKGEYGPSHIKVGGLSTHDVKKLFMVEPGSTLIIDGKMVEANARNIKDVLYE